MPAALRMTLRPPSHPTRYCARSDWSPDSSTSTTVAPPKIWVWARSIDRTSVALLMRVEPVLAWTLPATSLESYVVANRTMFGRCSRIRPTSAWTAGWAGYSA